MTNMPKPTMWPVVPICEAQRQDIAPEHLFEGGLYRYCDTYKGGGGYDQFPKIFAKRNGWNEFGLNDQFVVQLKGCPFKCPYCYVTPSGVNGEHILVSTDNMVKAYRNSGCSVFHLMGGAPAIYMNQWPELIDTLARSGAFIFHSDFVLYEGESIYDEGVLHELSERKHDCLYAVSIKGGSWAEYLNNTGVNVRMFKIWRNLELLIKHEIPFYMTFTGMSKESTEKFCMRVVDMFGPKCLEDAFNIGLVHYKALDYKKEEASQ